MGIDLKSIETFHCPRWEELPNIPLYMDQVVMVVEQALLLFSEEEKSITPAMINNYVKHGFLPPPVKKKYGRSHVAALIVIGIMKKVLSISEIISLMNAVTQELGEEEGYNMFCTRLEETLKIAFANEQDLNFFSWEESGVLSTLNGALTALMGKLYVQNYIEKYLLQTDIKKQFT